MEEDWACIHTTTQQYIAELLKGLLLENDIPAVVLSTKDSIYGTFGEFQLYVHRDKIIPARHLIDSHGN